MPLPEQTYFSIPELADRWEVKESRVLELLTTNRLRASTAGVRVSGTETSTTWNPGNLPVTVSFEGTMTFYLQFLSTANWYDLERLGWTEVSKYSESEEAVYKLTPPARITLDDLRVTSQELARFEKEHSINVTSTSNQRAPDQLGDLPADFRALYQSMGAGELPDIDLLITAWRKFWKDRTPTDRKPDPINADVSAWIMNRMEGGEPSKSKAMAMASIIRPNWAGKGGRPSCKD